jgi:hypothetical protein
VDEEYIANVMEGLLDCTGGLFWWCASLCLKDALQCRCEEAVTADGGVGLDRDAPSLSWPREEVGEVVDWAWLSEYTLRDEGVR